MLNGGSPAGRLVVQRDSSRATVVMTGEIDLDAVRAADKRLRALLDKPPDTVDVDLGGVTFIDSSGIAALVKLYSSADDAGGTMTIHSVTPPVVRLLEICGLLDIFQVSPDGQAPG